MSDEGMERAWREDQEADRVMRDAQEALRPLLGAKRVGPLADDIEALIAALQKRRDQIVAVWD